MERLDPSGYRRTPWKNGGGVTVDLADAYVVGAAPGGWDGMLWRFGHTRIVAPGPFSDLTGYDRILTVIGGCGLVLQIEGGVALDVREPLRPVRFRGEDRITSRLEAGPVHVLNLIADRRRHTIDVAILHGAEGDALDGAINVVYALRSSTITIGTATAELAIDEALRVGGDRPLAVESGLVAVAKINSRNAP